MGEFLLRSHPILEDGTRVTKRQWHHLLRLKCDLRDTLQSEGLISPNDDGEIVRAAILKRYKEVYGGD